MVKIVNGKGSVTWTVPDDYEGDYPVKVSFEGSDIYYPANYTGNGIGVVSVIPDDVPPIDDDNKSSAEHVDIKTDDNVTGNPILALLMALSLLGINIKRKK